MKELESNIWLERIGKETPDGYYAPGFYYSDETGWLTGPFKLIKEAKDALAYYCEHVLGRSED